MTQWSDDQKNGAPERADVDALSRLGSQRVEYSEHDLADVAQTPFAQFTGWYQAAAEALTEPNAMIVATADDSGPSARIVLLKDFAPQGFTFFTSYTSLKGAQIAADPAVALVFPWHEMERQVRVRGIAQRTSAAVSDAYFASRTRGSQLGAVASQQSQPVESRAELEVAYARAQAAYDGTDVARPATWGGYRVEAAEVEFWQGRGNRFHDRWVYRSRSGKPADLSDADAWTITRLNP